MNNDIPSDFKEDNQLLLDLVDPDGTDVYLIRVPKGFDVSKLHGTEFCASEIKEIEAEVGANQLTSVYELSTFDGEGLDVSPLIKSGQTSTILGSPMKGFLSVSKTYRGNFEISNDISHLMEPVTRVAMPEGLRVRFTHFGIGKPLKKSSHGSKKKKRKRKHSLDIPDSAPTQDELHVRKKSKTHHDDGYTQDMLHVNKKHKMHDDVETQPQHFHKKHKNKRKKN